MTDLDRLRTEYDRRAQDPRYREWYSPFNTANIFITQERDREIAGSLARHIHADWGAYRILDVGCGGGDELAKFKAFGVQSQHLIGVDLLPHRLGEARKRHPDLAFTCTNGEALPYADGTFDMVLLFTVLTSILDNALRARMGTEVLRVLKPAGRVLWYDFRLNPTNSQTRGIEKNEVRHLFPNCEYSFRRITLAPPIVRWVAPRSWFLCELLNQLPFLRTHYLALIRKRQD